MRSLEWDEGISILSARVHVRTKGAVECDLCHEPISPGQEYLSVIALDHNRRMMREAQHLRHLDPYDLSCWFSYNRPKPRKVAA